MTNAELIARLREPFDIEDTWGAFKEAADRIEALERENADLRALALTATSEWESWVEDQLSGTRMHADAIKEVSDHRERINAAK